jgi:CRISPR-associated endonuclease/helicase Cas3
MSSGMAKAERIREMERLYTQRPFSDIEMAARLGVNRTTIYRDRMEMSLEMPIVQDEEGRWKIDKEHYLSNVRLNLHEALALYLAARRTSRSVQGAQPHVISALEKLAVALKQPMTERLVRAAGQMLEGDPQVGRAQVMEALARGWAERFKVRIQHQGLHQDKLREYLVSPYLIEPSIWSDGVYLIGASEQHGSIATFKIERIQEAWLTAQSFELPQDFDETKLLRYAWGIWYAEQEPVQVRLRFREGAAARRLRESKWHPTQEIEELEDGGCIWQAQVAEAREMLPWVRGWGADCEVLEPQELRRWVEEEVKALNRLYELRNDKVSLIAHLREKDKVPQSLWDHLTAVSKFSGQFAEKIDLKETGELIGLIHDLGKASDIFQDYLRSATGLINPDEDDYIDAKSYKGKIDHSSAGAQLIFKKLSENGQAEKIVAQILSLCIASHHSGLIDCISPDGENNFERRMKKPDDDTHLTEALSRLNDDENNEIKHFIEQGLYIDPLVRKLQDLKEEGDCTETYFFKSGLLIRYLLSCLIDADRIDTADFEFPANKKIRNSNQYTSWDLLSERLEKKYQEFGNIDQNNEVNKLRSYVADSCLEYATKPPGIYQLTVPTGGGKTLASLRFALNHAKHHTLDHVFYVIPYTSIIDQNADQVREILEEKDHDGKYLTEVVLEHHSNLTPEEESYKQKLISQNWDAPIIFTTQVQFFESLFGSGTRGVRRMHQLANSVIIFDEVQTIPINSIHMFNLAVRFLVHSCGATVVLCTATQPPLENIADKHRALTIQPDQRIIPNEKELFEKLKRVEVFDQQKVGGWTDDEISNLIEDEFVKTGSVLVVVNTKKSAQSLFSKIATKEIAKTFHLSTNMCPAHRLVVLAKIKESLEKREPAICISTQLIEAGVDIDFGSVIRYMAGLDSIAQSAGRCNRNGEREIGNVLIVNPTDENIERLTEIKVGKEKTERILDDFRDDPEIFNYDRIGLAAMSKFYAYYFYDRKDDMKYNVNKNSIVGREDDLFNLLSKNNISVSSFSRVNGQEPNIVFRQSFQTANKLFQLIDSKTRGVVVPYCEKGEELITDLCGAFELEKQTKLLRSAQRYSVNVYLNRFEHMLKEDFIYEAQKGSGIYCLRKEYYDKDFGLSDEMVNEMDNYIC